MSRGSRASLCSDVLFILSDDDARRMFQQILENHGKEIRPSDYGTAKKYYERLKALKDAALVKRIGTGKFIPTIFGRIISELLQTTEIACTMAWRLKAIEQIDNSSIPQEERTKVIQTLVPDPEIQRMLLET